MSNKQYNTVLLIKCTLAEIEAEKKENSNHLILESKQL